MSPPPKINPAYAVKKRSSAAPPSDSRPLPLSQFSGSVPGYSISGKCHVI